MISIYEAVAPAVQQPVQQTQGAVVPQVQPQQPAQPAQVPAQQPAANAGQTVTDSAAQPQDKWKGYLKNAALISAGLGAGGLLYMGASNWDNIKDYVGRWLPGSSVPIPDSGETVENDNSSDNASTRATTNTTNTRSVSGVRTIYQPAPMIGPKSTTTVDPATYSHHMPQPANSRSWLYQSTGRRGYVSNGGYGYGGADVVDDSVLPYGSRGTSLTQGIYTRPKSQPITDYDLGRRSGDFNGA